MNNCEYYISKLIKKLHLKAVLNSKLHRKSKVNAGSHLVNVIMDKYSDVGYDCTILNASIGSFCSLGCNIKIGGASHSVAWVSTSPVFNCNKDDLSWKFSRHKFNPWLDTIIGSDVWIADNVMIKAGVTIGHGTVIGMGSVVTKDIPPYEIWAGNPARFISKRFDDAIIDSLLEIRWWSWEDEKIEAAASYFDDVCTFVDKYRFVVGAK